MAAAKFAQGGSKMTMRATKAGSSSAGPARRSGPRGSASNRGSKKPAAAAHDASDSDEAVQDDQISLEGDEDEVDDDEPDTEDEIEAAKGAGAKSKKTAKRKRRATSPTSFGNALEGLLGIAPSTSAATLDTLEESDEDENAAEKASRKKAKQTSTKAEAQVPAILSLAPHLRRSAQSTSLSARAARIALEQKRRREERCHVKDVIGGWGAPGVLPPMEDEDGNIIETAPATGDEAERLQEFVTQGGSTVYERKLRKVAQRGVVKLFNAIRAAQTTTEDDLEEVEAKQSAAKGAAKASAAASSASGKKAGLASKDARLADLSKSNFLDLIKKGSKPKSSSVAAK